MAQIMETHGAIPAQPILDLRSHPDIFNTGTLKFTIKENKMKSMFIFYVADQERTHQFYRNTLQLEPSLHVPGMTEFTLEDGSKIGFMPEQGINRLFDGNAPDVSQANGMPRAEMYLMVEDAQACHSRALKAGAKQILPFRDMSWGDKAAYCLDLDGHVIAFAQPRE